MAKIIFILLLGFLIAPAILVMFRDPGQPEVHAIQKRNIEKMDETIAKYRKQMQEGTDPISSWRNH